MASFQWECPSCGHQHDDGIDGVDGPFITVICSACNSCFDDNALEPSEVKAWGEAITQAQAELAAKNAAS